MLADKEPQKKIKTGKNKITWKKIVEEVNKREKELGELSESTVKKRKIALVEEFKARQRVNAVSSGISESYSDLDKAIDRYSTPINQNGTKKF
jgi:pyruvate/2-oxoglutarate dehydrogenase complex dihydrolipoamide dehydrogenase (E3) component